PPTSTVSRPPRRHRLAAPAKQLMWEAGSVQVELRPRFEHQVERRLRRAPEALEAGRGHDLAQSCFAGLRTETERDFLAARSGRAHERRSAVEDAADRVEVVFDAIA